MLVQKLNLAFWKNAHLLEKRSFLFVFIRKIYIIEYKGDNLLNQRKKFVSKCQHKNKFKLVNQKTWYA